jgi:hypothetical protein
VHAVRVDHGKLKVTIERCGRDRLPHNQKCKAQGA